MTPDDETLMAYADGELSFEESRAVEAAIASRPDLKAVVEQQSALRGRIDASFAPMMGEEPPDRLLQTLAETPVSVRWQMFQTIRRALRGNANRRFLSWSGLPAGAALACGIVLGVMLAPRGTFRDEGGAMIARGALAAALDTQLASNQAGGNIHIGLSFKAKDGRYCRTFESGGSASSLAGVACRNSSGWAVAALAATPRENFTYRMAGAMPDAVRKTVENMISGEPLDASGEEHARNAGWRNR
jgi:hypothetical protein